MQTPTAAKFSFHVYIKENRKQQEKEKKNLDESKSFARHAFTTLPAAPRTFCVYVFVHCCWKFQYHLPQPNCHLSAPAHLSWHSALARKLSTLLPVLRVFVCSCVRGRWKKNVNKRKDCSKWKKVRVQSQKMWAKRRRQTETLGAVVAAARLKANRALLVARMCWRLRCAHSICWQRTEYAKPGQIYMHLILGFSHRWRSWQARWSGGRIVGYTYATRSRSRSPPPSRPCWSWSSSRSALWLGQQSKVV